MRSILLSWTMLAVACHGRLSTLEGDASNDGGPAAPRCDIGAIRAAIVDGTDESALGLTEDDGAAVVLVSAQTGDCSGVRIAPRWVMTAAHCVEGSMPHHILVRSEGHPAAPRRGDIVDRMEPHPRLDAVLLRTLRPGARHAPLPHRPLDASWEGRVAEAAGYGERENGDHGERRFFVVRIAAVLEEALGVDARGRGGVCRGDSGGPLFARVDDGSVRVIGIVDAGDGSCRRRARFVRTDRLLSWAEDVSEEVLTRGPCRAP